MPAEPSPNWRPLACPDPTRSAPGYRQRCGDFAIVWLPRPLRSPRLPNKDGKGVKGMHPLQLELDEAQDYPLAGWIELIETLKRGSQNARWHCHGVPRGVRDKFFEITQADSDFTVHRLMAMHRPSWTPQERDEKIKTYGGSRQNPDYKRNIYGDHGDARNPVFVLARLMACVDQDEGSEYNTEVYSRISISFEQLSSRMGRRGRGPSRSRAPDRRPHPGARRRSRRALPTAARRMTVCIHTLNALVHLVVGAWLAPFTPKMGRHPRRRRGGHSRRLAADRHESCMSSHPPAQPSANYRKPDGGSPRAPAVTGVECGPTSAQWSPGMRPKPDRTEIDCGRCP